RFTQTHTTGRDNQRLPEREGSGRSLPQTGSLRDGQPCGLRAARLIYSSIRPRSSTGASDFGSEGWGFDSLRGRHLHSISETPHPAAHISISTASFGRVLAAQGAGVILSLRVAIPTTCGK